VGAPYSNGWSDTDRRAAYHLSTGGEILSLALLQSLERSKLPQEGADGQLVPFMHNLERYGFIPDPVSCRESVRAPGRLDCHAVAAGYDGRDRIQLHHLPCGRAACWRQDGQG
jgi:hypothetical protein